MDEEDVGVMNESGHFAFTLKYLDFIPQKVNANENAFENIDTLVLNVNQRLQKADAARWKLIALESLKVEANGDWVIDCEESLVEESARHVTILRLFYEEFNFEDEEMWPMRNEIVAIEIEDFKPRHLSGGSFFKRPQFEPFSGLVQRAAKWLTSQATLHFMNAQTIDVKVKSRKLLLTFSCSCMLIHFQSSRRLVSKIESRVSSQTENGDYIQILRIVCWHSTHSGGRGGNKQNLRPKSSTGGRQQAANQFYLGTKVIMATKLYHPLDSLQQRIFTWLKGDTRQEIVVISAETVDIYSKDDDEKNLERALEDCFQSNRLGSLNTYAFTALRLFYCILPDEGGVEDVDRSEPSLCSRTMSLSALNNSGSSSVGTGTTVSTTTVSSMASIVNPPRPTQVTFNLVCAAEPAKKGDQGGGAARGNKDKTLSHQMSESSATSRAVVRRRPSEYNFEGQIRRRARTNASSCNCM